MRKQNEITTLLIQQQCLSSLPRTEIQIFDGDPLKYNTFIRAFENGVKRNTKNCSDKLYFLEQYTKSHPKELVRSCQHLNPERGNVKAKALLWEHFGNEQQVASAYMERTHKKKIGFLQVPYYTVFHQYHTAVRGPKTLCSICKVLNFSCLIVTLQSSIQGSLFLCLHL